MGSKLAGENALETYGGPEGFHKPVGGQRRMSDLIGSLCADLRGIQGLMTSKPIS